MHYDNQGAPGPRGATAPTVTGEGSSRFKSSAATTSVLSLMLAVPLAVFSACASAPPPVADSYELVLGRGAPGGPLPAPKTPPIVTASSPNEHPGPWTPALRALQGQVPLVKVSMSPSSADSARAPTFDVAVFEDGTVAYEGQQCVKVGGLLLTHLSAGELKGLREYLATVCATDVPATSANDGELCVPANEKVQITCSTGKRVLSSAERCGAGGDGGGKTQVLANELASRVHVDGWIGAAQDRQSCEPDASALSAGELKLLLRIAEPSDSKLATRQ